MPPLKKAGYIVADRMELLNGRQGDRLIYADFPTEEAAKSYVRTDDMEPCSVLPATIGLLRYLKKHGGDIGWRVRDGVACLPEEVGGVEC